MHKYMHSICIVYACFIMGNDFCSRIVIIDFQSLVSTYIVCERQSAMQELTSKRLAE